jgi:malate dehydrogenase
MTKTISLIGLGNIGSNIATQLLPLGFEGEIKIYDRNTEKTAGKIIDLTNADYIFNNNKPKIQFSLCQKTKEAFIDSDVAIITAGVPRTVGMTRDDVFNINKEIIINLAQEYKLLKQITAKLPFIIIITNPLDAMAYLFYKHSSIKHNKIIGMSGILDTTRLNMFLHQNQIQNTHGSVYGLHNDEMLCTFDNIIDENKKNKITTETINCGATINKLSGSSAFIAPASAAIKIAMSVLYDKKESFICSCRANGVLNFEDEFFSMNTTIEKEGIVSQGLPPSLTQQEIEQLKISIEKHYKNLKNI